MMNIDPPLAVVLIIFSLIDRVSLCEYSPADSADDAEECSKLHYFAEKDMFGVFHAVIAVWVLSAIICEICGRHCGLVCANCLSTLAWLFSRR